ncbi:MAG: FtsW/RodA/SpoVE family cell cycle protein [Fimbriimonadaceae bacterium]|nr:FtsW/RodA/SpoVE family cell cycle protein [Fimbriimonadaceae bacterium]
MPRRTERALLGSALGLSLAGAVLVAVARGADLLALPTGGPTLTFYQVLGVQLQVAAAFGLCHALLAWRRPRVDQYVLPVAAALTGLGLAIIFSLQPEQAARQVTWLWLSLALFAAVVGWGPEPALLGRYKYLLGLLTAALLLLPILVGTEVNGARLWIRLGSFTLQPGELAKIALVLFLAGYLAEKGELLAAEPRRLGSVAIPDPQLLLPLLLLWAAGLALLVLLRDLGTALLFFGTAVVMLYLATAQLGWLALGGVSFAGGAWVCGQLFGHVRARLANWVDPWPKIETTGFQPIQGMFAIAAGGLGGVGLGQGLARSIPAATTDYPFAALCEELGLWGAGVLLALYLILVYRGLHHGLRQPGRFEALTAAGLGCLLGFQALVICAGVVRLIPLTGITLPFVSYGGSSLLTNYLALALLLRCSEEPR